MSSKLAERSAATTPPDRNVSCEVSPATSPTLSASTTPDGDSESGSSSCACSNIAIMQLFHELKAEFPTVPDHVVSQCISDHYHDRDTCRSLLSAEQARVPRGVPYPPGLMGVISGRVDPTPLTCYCNSIDLQRNDNNSSPGDDDSTSKCSSENFERYAEFPCKCGKLGSAKVNRGTTIYQDDNNDAVDVNQVIIQTKDNLNKVASGVKTTRGDSKSDLNLINLKKSLQKVVPFNNLKKIKSKVFNKHRHHFHHHQSDDKNSASNNSSTKNHIRVPNNTTSKLNNKDNDVSATQISQVVKCVDGIHCVNKCDKENNNNLMISRSHNLSSTNNCVSSSGSNESEKSSSCTDTTVIKKVINQGEKKPNSVVPLRQMSEPTASNVSKHSKTSHSVSSKTRISRTRHVGDVTMNVQTESVAFDIHDDGFKTGNFRSYRRSSSKTNPDSGFFGESSMIDNGDHLLETAAKIEQLLNRKTSMDDVCSTISTLKTKSQSMESMLSEGGYYGDTDSSVLRTSPISQRSIAEESIRSGSLHSKYGSDRVLTSSRRRHRREEQIETVSSSESTTSDSTHLRLNRHLDERIEKPKSPFMLKKSSRMKHFDQNIECVPHNSPRPPPAPIKPARSRRNQHSITPESSNKPDNENSSSTPEPGLHHQKPPLPKRPNSLELKPGIPPGSFHSPGSVNVSLNVNVDVVSPLPNRRSTVININPKPFWAGADPQSPRSYTSVNLTLRPPCSEPQDPIDISSANSRLTYSTSSYDPRKGLQSSLQITVGPAGGTVSSVRTRPRSTYFDQTQQSPVQLTPRAGSLPNLSTPLVQRQIERKEKLRIELESEKGRLLAIQQEIHDLEAMTPELTAIDADLEEQRLKQEIEYYERECKRLAEEVDRRAQPTRDISITVPLGETNVEFYRNIYTGPRGTLRPPMQPATQHVLESSVHWTCNMCTFSNHPLMDKCEQCDMPRIVLVSASPGDNIHIHVTPGPNRRTIHSGLCYNAD